MLRGHQREWSEDEDEGEEGDETVDEEHGAVLPQEEQHLQVGSFR